ncbi:MAG: hypothetical protein CMM58_08405 [Rhodospirillaceae bacterium]|nr:hypothetical protein [Rhodospirillaceae bacterium]
MSILVLYLVKYHNDQKAGMISDGEQRDRAQVHRKAIADFGGKPIAQYGSYGEYDMAYIYEMPDEKSLAANLHLTDSLGLAKYCKTIPQLNSEEFVQSLALAGTTKTDYRAATKTCFFYYISLL